MKRIMAFLLAAITLVSLSACKPEEISPEKEQENPTVSENSGEVAEEAENEPVEDGKRKEVSAEGFENAVEIVLSEKITIGGKAPEESDCVTVGGEIVYYKNIEKYPSGNKYGNGEEKDMHTEEEAAEYTLVTVTKPGEYFIRGELKGQLAVDLGEDAKNDPEAKVTLIFGGADITCEIAPAVIFYNVYECENAEKLSEKSGANILIADGSQSNINGANVAKIFKDNGKEEKLHKYDGALYSKMSMNIFGDKNGTGILNINGENEGIGSEMHLSFNGGMVNVKANDDGINANEDGISVISVNGGKLTVSGGFGIEGDGIDSNGSLVINGGELYAFGNGRSADGGIDADNGIYINGGKVAAFGNRNDSISKDSKQNFAVLEFSTEVSGNSNFEFIDSEGNGIKIESKRLFGSVVVSDESFAEGKEYYLKMDGKLQEYAENRSETMFEGGVFEPSEFEGFAGMFTDPSVTAPKPSAKKNPYEKPEGLEEWLESEKDMPEEIREWIENMAEVSSEFAVIMNPGREFERNEVPKPEPEPESGKKETVGGFFELVEEGKEDKTVFVINSEKPIFTGITLSEKFSGKKTVSFDINGSKKMEDVYFGDLPEIVSIGCSEEVPPEDIRIMLTYTGRDTKINVMRSCFLSEGYENVTALFKGLEKGDYRISIEVVEENEKYMGIEYFAFDVMD